MLPTHLQLTLQNLLLGCLHSLVVLIFGFAAHLPAADVEELLLEHLELILGHGSEVSSELQPFANQLRCVCTLM